MSENKEKAKVSEATAKLLEQASNKKVDATIDSVKADVGVGIAVVGAADTVFGEKASGVTIAAFGAKCMIKKLPSIAKQCGADIDYARSVYSCATDLQGRSLKEQFEITGDFAKTAFTSGKDAIADKPKEFMDTAKSVTTSVSDIAKKTGEVATGKTELTDAVKDVTDDFKAKSEAKKEEKLQNKAELKEAIAERDAAANERVKAQIIDIKEVFAKANDKAYGRSTDRRDKASELVQNIDMESPSVQMAL